VTVGSSGAGAALPLPRHVLPGGRFAAWRPQRPRYVVCDVDGTLVGPQVHATDEVVAAVARAQGAGIRVGFATGRMRDAVGSLATQLGAVGPHVLHNGAEVRAEGHTIASWTIAPAQVDSLLALARGRDDAYVEIYTECRYLVSALDERARPHWTVLGRGPDGVIRSAADLDGEPVLKATFAAFEESAVAPLIAGIGALGLLAGPAGSPRTPDLRYVNATDPAADKGRALAEAAAHLGLELAAVAAVGDAHNDLSMLAVAGTAIAMGQADAEVRAAAHLIVPDVDAHGVAVALDAVIGWQDAPGERLQRP
jgi:hydroxymethylpyrimidine pyrophosphatase-like HAD family hydrolase